MFPFARDRFELRLNLDALSATSTTQLALGGQNVYEYPLVRFGAGIAFGVRF